MLPLLNFTRKLCFWEQLQDIRTYPETKCCRGVKTHTMQFNRKPTPALCCEVVHGVWQRGEWCSEFVVWRSASHIYSSSVGWDTSWLVLASLCACIQTEQWLLLRSCSILENPKRFTVKALRSMPARLRLELSTCQVLIIIPCVCVGVCDCVVEYSGIHRAALVIMSALIFSPVWCV